MEDHYSNTVPIAINESEGGQLDQPECRSINMSTNSVAFTSCDILTSRRGCNFCRIL